VTDAIRGALTDWMSQPNSLAGVVQPVQSSAPSALDVLGYVFLGLASSA